MYKDISKRKDFISKYYLKNKDRINQQRRERHRKIRLQILSHYSKGKLECACCQEKILIFLAIDHIEGEGTKHIETLSSRSIERFLIKNNFPEGYQVLCHNCNFGKYIYGECPHKMEGSPNGGAAVLKTAVATHGGSNPSPSAC